MGVVLGSKQQESLQNLGRAMDSMVTLGAKIPNVYA